MATLTSRSTHPASLGAGYNPSRFNSTASQHTAIVGSPSESEFSEHDTQDAIRRWDEVKVGEWLRQINCAQYVDLFKSEPSSFYPCDKTNMSGNNINGENLMDMDQSSLKEMGVIKVGDRIRMAAQAKQFRNSVYQRTSKKVLNRQSLALLDGSTFVSPQSSTASPRSNYVPSTARADRRMSRRFELPDATAFKTSSRPSSPLVGQGYSSRARHGQASPHDPAKNQTYFVKSSAMDNSLSLRSVSHNRLQSTDQSNAAKLPPGKQLIRVIYDTGSSSVVSIQDCATAEDVMCKTLRKQQLNENHAPSYRFYILDGTPRGTDSRCRQLGDSELMRICQDQYDNQRSRLMLRSKHQGEPVGEQLRVATRMASEDLDATSDSDYHSKPKTAPKRRHNKAEAILGESLPSATYPMSPASQESRDSYLQYEQASLERTTSSASNTSASSRARKLRDLLGERPPTELITQDLTSYFPDVQKHEMDRTVRMSIRRSQRLSRAYNRMSTASNMSFGSSLKDAPPLPSIADTWFNAPSTSGSPSESTSSTSKSSSSLRPLSVVRLGRPLSRSQYRESMASSVLEPLDEESPLEPSRQSYVSFGDNSGSDSATGTDSGSATMLRSSFDDGDSPSQTENGGSLNSHLSRALAEDGEEIDEELMEHLEKDSWEDLRYMKGKMIGQGSFGTVYLALHAITAELMALKQVEMPSSANTAVDAKKNNMVEALKREIDLLRELKHPNIVQYLGSNSDDTHLNIFLEYVAGGSVATMLNNYGPLPEPLVSNFVRQILTGLDYLHSMDIIHRDIKGANILVDNHGSVKISDFGISKRVETTIRTSMARQPKKGGPRVSLQGSVFWMAPEVVKQTAYTRKADIWSLGCLIVEMFTGTHPHPNCTQLQAIFKIGGKEQAKPEIPEELSDNVKAFLEKTFEYNHEMRPSAEELLEYPFVAAKPSEAAAPGP